MIQKIKILVVLVCFFFNTGLPTLSFAQSTPTFLDLPAPGTLLAPSPAFTPALIKGLKIDPKNALAFDFIIDTGDSNLTGDALRKESAKMIKYFLAALTVPEGDLWVNLSPYEKNKIVADGLGQTGMGRDMLGQDYVLKQLTASLIYPESQLGKTFWGEVYSKAQKQYGTTDIPVNTFNKVWIVPQHATIYEHNGTAFVIENKLKVMLEEDYLSLQKHSPSFVKEGMRGSSTHTLGSQIIRKILIPEIEKEVNTGKNFATLRQIANASVLAAWYKQALKESLLGRIYANKNKINGVESADKNVKMKIYDQYLQAFKKGVFNYIKEDVDPLTDARVARKYFSGGALLRWSKAMTVVTKDNLTQVNRAEIARAGRSKNAVEVAGLFNVSSPAMNTRQALDQVEDIQRRFDLIWKNKNYPAISTAFIPALNDYLYRLQMLGVSTTDLSDEQETEELTSRMFSLFVEISFVIDMLSKAMTGVHNLNSSLQIVENFLNAWEKSGTKKGLPTQILFKHLQESLGNISHDTGHLPLSDRQALNERIRQLDEKVKEALSSMDEARPDTAMVNASKKYLMSQKIKTIGVLAGGGPATGLNSVMEALVRESLGTGVKIVGIPNGWLGLADANYRKRIRQLTHKEMKRVKTKGGSHIKSSRTNPVGVSEKEIDDELKRLGYSVPQSVSKIIREEAKQALTKIKVEALIRICKERGIDALVVLGGDDTNGVSAIIHKYAPDFPILGIPKTMDYDVFLPEGAPTYGYNSFITAGANNLKNVIVSAKSLERILVVDTFGRDAGFTTLGAGARAGITFALIPEMGEIDMDKFVKKVRAFYKKNKYAVIIVSEGVKLGQTQKTVGEADNFGHKKLGGINEVLAEILRERLKDIEGLIVTPVEKLGYSTRESTISPEDYEITQNLGRAAFEFLMNGVTGRILYTDKNYHVRAMSFPDKNGIATYIDDTGKERKMNLPELRGLGKDATDEEKIKIGGRSVKFKKGGAEHEYFIAANQGLYGERSIIARISLELNRIGREMAFDFVNMKQLYTLHEELDQLKHDIGDIRETKNISFKRKLARRANATKKILENLIIQKAKRIAKTGRVSAAMTRASIHETTVHPDRQGGINLDPAMYSMQIRRDGNGIPLPVDEQPIDKINISGISAVIKSIKPANLAALLGPSLN